MRLILCLGLLVAACGSNKVAVDAPVADVSLEPSISATPNPTTIAPGGSIVLTLTTTNFNVVDPRASPPPMPGEGHYHYYLDDAVNYVAAWTPTVDIRIPANAAPGAHAIRLVLVTNAHVDVVPTVETTVTFTVE